MASPSKYLLGVDVGNTVIKAVLFDLNGQQIASHALDGQTSTPQPGYVERDLNELWQNAQQVIKGCIQAAKIDPSQIAGIGCAGHGNGLYLLDGDGEALLGIQSLDTRAAGLAAELNERNGEALHEICLQKPWPSQTPVLLAWIKEHQPEIYKKAATVLLCKDFLNAKLTGERVAEVSDMSGCGLTRLPACVYDDELLELYGLSDAKDKLPRLVSSDSIVGTITDEAAKSTGLAPGTPVIGGYFDVVASALGSGAVHKGDASIIVGTWSVNQVFSAQPVRDQDVFMVTCFGPDRFVNIESSATSAVNLEWYVREFIERGEHHDDPFGYCSDMVAQIEPAADDPIYHPFLYGSGQSAHYRAGFYGIAGWHKEAHLIKALFEGVAFEHKRHVNVLAKSGLNIEKAILSGGGARSPVWPQIFADCLGLQLTTAKAQETGALGAAIGAGVGVGLFASYEQAVDQMTSPSGHFAPNEETRQHYQSRFKSFCDLSVSLNSFWQQTNESGS